MQTADTLARPVLHRNEISRVFDFQDGGCPPSSIFETEIFNTCAFQKNVLHHRAKFCADRSYCCRDTAIFSVFLLKCNNSLDYRA